MLDFDYRISIEHIDPYGDKFNGQVDSRQSGAEDGIEPDGPL